MVGEEHGDADLAEVEPLRARVLRDKVVDDRDGAGRLGRSLLLLLEAQGFVPALIKERERRIDDCDLARRRKFLVIPFASDITIWA